MSFRPPRSRERLGWKVFSQEDADSWKLVLPTYYASLFARVCAPLMKKAGRDFRESKSGKTLQTVFHDLTEQEVARIGAFLTFYERAVCIGANPHINKHFADELDFAVALDSIRPDRGSRRTEIGELEFQAKYNQDEEAAFRLADELCRAIRLLPSTPKPRILTYVPSNRGKRFHLPADLAIMIHQRTPAAFWGTETPLLHPQLKVVKKSAKDLAVAEKMEQWESLFRAGDIETPALVEGCSAIVIDDLYQSGVSLWSFAKYLKARGAGTVVGLACVKSLRDTDNR